MTPIFGGGATPREVDQLDCIRVPSIRGQLRFWWRALRGHEFDGPEALFKEETNLWGGPTGNQGRRSPVELRVAIQRLGALDSGPATKGKRARGAYALWPAREQRSDEGPREPRASLRLPETQFELEVVFPAEREREIRGVLTAWLLFGGYGSRTRRGLGTLTVLANGSEWLPSEAKREAFQALFGRDIFAPPARPDPGNTPWLAGAALHVGGTPLDAEAAWDQALGWLEDFRQGTSGDPGSRAREPGTGKDQPWRPSISNWPEADKIRHLTKRTGGHTPRHNAEPAWPRAGFGLPIISRFQRKGRREEQLSEPSDFQLIWRNGGKEHERLASPLILKALPLADGTFVPCALWLNRSYPEGKVVARSGSKKPIPKSEAPFNRLLAPGDEPRFEPLRGADTLRKAFLSWLRKKHGTVVVAP
ncbi:MAG: type III-B CRISPR module RAMP protein Cmr1 [Planctomycetota bacterium]